MIEKEHHSFLNLFPEHFLGKNLRVNNPNFSETFFEARSKFLDVASTTNGEVKSYLLNTRSNLSDELHIDFLNLVKGTPKKTLLYISGIHGAEANSGSGIEIDLLTRGFKQANNTQVVFCHVINPFGMVESHRTNEDNIDLNRNFILDAFYDVFSVSLPEGMFPRNLSELNETLNYILQLEGKESIDFQQSVSSLFSGQSHDSSSLFYSGNELSESYRILIDFFDNHIPGSVKDIFTVDIHTGLGDFGKELLFSNLRNLLSNGVDLNLSLQKTDGLIIIPPNVDDPTYYEASGDSVKGITDYFKRRNIVSNGICQEFGTYPFKIMISALLIDNFYRTNGIEKPEFVSKIMKETFNPNSIAWQESILSKGERLFNALLNSYLS